MDNHKNINKNLEIIAEREGITPQEVYDEIALAISFAMKDPNPEIQNFWRNIPCQGDSPTVEEVIDYLSNKILNQ